MGPSVDQGLAEGWCFRDGAYNQLIVVREHFYADGQFLGEAERLWIHTSEHRPGRMPSVVFVCPSCGEAWARRLLDRTDWVCEMRRCFQHEGGELLFDIERADSDFPRSVLYRELFLLCRDSNNF